MKNNDSPIRVLHISYGSGTFGGAARFAINYYKHINQNKVIFDFLFCNKDSFGLIRDDQLLKRSRITSLNAFEGCNSISGYFKLIKKLKEFLNSNRYDIVHIDSGGQPVQLACLYACYVAGVPVRIAHSHSSGDYSKKNSIKTKMKDIIKPINRGIIRKLASDYYACSMMAGVYMFGKVGVKSEKFSIIPNAIELDKYTFDIQKRKALRSEYKISDDTIVYGHVGRFDKAKNHLFLVDVFDEICKINPNSLLWIIGDGELKSAISDKIEKCHFKENIVLLGERNNVSEYYQAMDAIIFPSIYEGLSIVTIEAQSAGLPIYASSNITKEHNVSGNVSFFNLSDGPNKWAKEITKTMMQFNRESCKSRMIRAGYDIQTEAIKLQNIYINKWLELNNVKK